MNIPILRLSGNLALNLALDTLKINKQALVFAGTKPSCEKLAEDIAGKIQSELPSLSEMAASAEHALSSPTKQCKRLATCLRKGIAFHHAGLTASQRELVENNFRSGLIKIICCTPTLAMGVDIPAFRSIIKDLKRFGDDGMGFIPVLEYLQMAGRAGRPRFDKEGQAIILALTETEKEKLTDKYINGVPEAIESKLAVEPVLRTFLLSLIASDFVSTTEEILGFFSKTFWAAQYGDMRELRGKIENMLDELVGWEFLESSEDTFVSASQLGSASYQATRVGKRVAELYLDPYTARCLILAMHKAAKSALHDVPLLHMLCCTLEMRPLLRVRAKEIDTINGELAQYEGTLFVPEPSVYEPEYDDYLNGFKTALFMKSWIEEKDEEFLLETFNIRPGEIRTKLDIADWLCYTAIELAKLLQFREAEKALLKLRFRLKNGVKEELLPLIRLKNIGRARARRLFRNGIKDIGDVKKADLVLLSQLLGKAVAVDVKKQVGQDYSSVVSGSPQPILTDKIN